MLEILLYVYSGKSFMKLAADFGKSKWLFAIIGFVFCLVITYLATFGFAILMSDKFAQDSDLEAGLKLSMISMPVGALITFGIYSLLKKMWEKESNKSDLDLLDEDLI